MYKPIAQAATDRDFGTAATVLGFRTSRDALWLANCIRNLLNTFSSSENNPEDMRGRAEVDEVDF